MTRRLALLLAACATAPAAEGLTVSAEEAGEEVSVRVGSALPKGAVLAVRIEREVGVLAPRFLVQSTSRGRVGADGSLEIRLRRGEALPVPGRYRVSALYDRQYPEVAARVASPPAPGRCLLEDGFHRRAYLEAVLKEQALLERFHADACAFLTRLAELRAEAGRDREAGARAWAAWREQAVPAFEAGLFYQRGLARRFFPETADSAASKVLGCILEWECTRFQSARAGGEPPPIGFCDGEKAVPLEVLDPWKAVLLKEAALYRLQVLNALFERATAHPQRRPEWDEVLALWSAGLDRLPHPAEMQALADAFKAWLDAPEAGRDPLQARFREVQALLK